jgi:hypothetical protein
MLDLLAGIQIARKATEQQLAYDADVRRRADRRTRWSATRGVTFFRRSRRDGSEQRPASAVGRADAC